jgi:hypothetical protein
MGFCMLSTAVNCQPAVRCVSCTWASACSQRRSTVNPVCGAYPAHGLLHAFNGGELSTWCAVRILHMGLCMLSTAVNCQPCVRCVSSRRSTVNLVCGAYPAHGPLHALNGAELPACLHACLPASGFLRLPPAPSGSLRLSPAPFGFLLFPPAPSGSLRLPPAPSGSLRLSPAPSVSLRLPPAPSGSLWLASVLCWLSPRARFHGRFHMAQHPPCPQNKS